MYVITWMTGNGDAARPGSVFELAVAALLRMEDPPVLLNHSNHVTKPSLTLLYAKTPHYNHASSTVPEECLSLAFTVASARRYW